MNKVYCITLSFLSLLFAQYKSYGQLQTAHWFFGQNTGLNFTSGTVTVDNNGQIVSPEGVASFSDELGNLLFYTDGSTVYTRNHAVMPNGTGLFGHLSSTQSSIIIPAPDNVNLYYIFTTDAIENFLLTPVGSQSKGLNYSIVDMSLGSDGEVTVKNSPLPLDGFQRSNEQITAVAKADCSGYWVMTHYFGKFYSFSVTAAGVDPNPVVTVAGPNSVLTGIGALKASHDGKKIAFTSYSESGGLRVYDFNNENGTFNNENILYMPPRQYYGVEFSPDNSVLYASTANNLLKYDLTAGPINSEVVLATNVSNMLGSLQLGLDGKIYYADVENFVDNKYLSVINFPNNFNNPGYVQDGIFLGRKRAYGLPNFIPYLYHAKLLINGVDDVTEFCEGTALDFSYCHVNRNSVTSTVLWDFGDGNTSTQVNPEYTYTSSGTFTVTLSLIIGGKTYRSETQIVIYPSPDAQNAQQEICLVSGVQHTFDLTQSYPQINPNNEVVAITFYAAEQDAQDENNALALNYTTAVSTTLWIRIENGNGCFVIRQIQLVINQIPTVNAQSPVNICEGNTAILGVTTHSSNTVNWYNSSGATIPIYTGNNFQTPQLTTNTHYWVEAVSPLGCASERFEIVVNVADQTAPLFDLQQIYCLNSQPMQLPTISDNGVMGSWSPSIINTSSIGTRTYTFTPSSGQCTSQQLVLQIQVIGNVTPEFNLITEYFFSEIASQALPNVSDNGISGIWDNPYIDNTSGTRTYTFIPNPDQCAKEFSTEIRVINYPHYFTPNNDGYHDSWNIWGFTRENNPKIYIFDRYGKLLKQLNPLIEAWDGTYNGYSIPADDYWFTVAFTIDGKNREFRAHFSLKR
ncbi:MAG: T9SS type B sorting domain-containing protein [Flavobacterium sp. JAD_PAG50586_2]|nr:MAG: T9SS type B sorting domain-containing protein [Flavobacterium sp. JAD_PAG50586_2]